ncbi:Sorting nexin C-terminal protein [Dioscorea alata]|uniref:Sorting nexin C-terminal protein n=1 Tax=Dioscorea alata TaxID=55571 RepID=A0ACB7VZV2_DIOAL|nr:Sorting nexin C-terminal protein [Dioscorea alata]
MGRVMANLKDLVEEFKVRTMYWAICIFVISYFLSHTSKSMWTNIPMSVLILSGIRYLSYEVELRWKVQPVRRQTYISHLEKKKLSVDESCLSSAPAKPKWRRKISPPPVEAAVHELVSKILQDFVVDLWYSSITPDKEVPELIRSTILDALGEISERIKGINLVDLLTRDMVDAIGKHLDAYRRIQTEIGVDDMGTLSSEERDARLKLCLLASKELHPALVSPECEHKVLQCIIGGVLAVVLKPEEAQCPLVRCFSRELLTCLVIEPVMNFASPEFVNELIECIFLNTKANREGQAGPDGSGNATVVVDGSSDSVGNPHAGPESEIVLSDQPPEKLAEADGIISIKTFEYGNPNEPQEDSGCFLHSQMAEQAAVIQDKYMVHTMQGSGDFSRSVLDTDNSSHISVDLVGETSARVDLCDEYEGNAVKVKSNKGLLKQSISKSDSETTIMSGEAIVMKELYYPKFSRHKTEPSGALLTLGEGVLCAPKLKCQVVGVSFKETRSKPFAVYSISVTDANYKTWLVERRYQNFERLHRHLKHLPNYSLYLPPKGFLISYMDNHFIRQRVVLLNKYLQDLLSIANVAEQHEVWDFLSVSSKNYSYGKATSVMKTFAVNVDEAMDDIVRQIKGVSDDLRRIVVGSSSSNTTSLAEKSLMLPWKEEIKRHHPRDSYVEAADNQSAYGSSEKDHHSATNTCHLDNELKYEIFSPRVSDHMKESMMLDLGKNQLADKFPNSTLDKFLANESSIVTHLLQDLDGIPPEWIPQNTSLPLLNLVDKIFLLDKQGWLRRQVFWISKQLVQLMMDDAIDDWMLRQISLLRNEEVIAQMIHWVQNILWPNGTFFTTSERDTCSESSTSDTHLEAVRRASLVKKIILGNPSAEHPPLPIKYH